MRSKAPLALMEQLVMILVFALAAALCLQVFVFADRISARNEETDRAVLVCQNAAETLKAVGPSADGVTAALEAAAPLLGGTLSGDVLRVRYDESWTPTTRNSGPYLLRVEALPAPADGLCQAALRVESAEETTGNRTLFELTVAWQEVSPHE